MPASPDIAPPADRFAFLSADATVASPGPKMAPPTDAAQSSRDPVTADLHPHAKAWRGARDWLARLEDSLIEDGAENAASWCLRQRLHACTNALVEVETAARALKATQDSAGLPASTRSRNAIADRERGVQHACTEAFAALQTLAMAIELHDEAMAPGKTKIGIHAVLSAAALIVLGVALFATSGVALVVLAALAGFAVLNGACAGAEVVRAALENPRDTGGFEDVRAALLGQIERLSWKPATGQTVASDEPSVPPPVPVEDAPATDAPTTNAQAPAPFVFPEIGSGADIVRLLAAIDPRLPAKARADIVNRARFAATTCLPIEELHDAAQAVLASIATLPEQERLRLLPGFAYGCCREIGSGGNRTREGDELLLATLRGILDSIGQLRPADRVSALVGLHAGSRLIYGWVREQSAPLLEALKASLPPAYRDSLQRSLDDYVPDDYGYARGYDQRYGV
ncbi:hypothetical protein K6V92_24270 [Cupriavidus respiraculi]|uniref:hypothetical protein n=1 Tax=Cupriavidus respiraculi TaxID=195930 RepID=UPI001C93B4FB|nr:hypothetical protein [Cupriavidus respiraculi]MBY4949727.1 hypothetical protein [Cupriavidus respiraculi]